ncbi:MAG: lamin tail domain-containing protein [Oscillospiraceae bacterium]|nr:lamin tail domain-containing protein [Oscillospiraceae bacterium]
MQTDQHKTFRMRIAVSVCVLLLIPLALLLGHVTGSSGGEVRINEILASNSAFPDPEGQCRDFIELYNGGSGAAELGGWGLTDAAAVKYRFPAGTVLGPGEYLVIWCDSAAEAGTDLAPFSIAKDGGETISLLNPRGRAADAAATIPAPRNHSMIPGEEGWVLCDTPTPGFPNTPEGYAACLAARSASAPAARISEFMSSNSLYPAPDGQYYDWIELCNEGSEALDLEGWSLSDDPSRPKYVFPAGTLLPAGGYLAVWCGEGGTGFSLSRDGGETLCLLAPGGALADRVEVPALGPNEAYALTGGGWETANPATPGFENSEAGFDAYLGSMGWKDCPVRISEVMAENRGCVLDDLGAFSDWIELRNDEGAAVELAGFWLSDDPAEPAKWRIPALSIPAGGCALVWCDGLSLLSPAGECHAGFSLSAYGETVSLSSPVGSLIDTLSFGPLGPDRSAAPGSAEPSDTPSPGYPNTPQGALDFAASLETPLLAVNELMSANGSVLRQSDGNYYDWVELRNNGEEAINLEGYGLSDDSAVPDRFVFPARTLEPGGLCVVLLTGGAEGRSNLPRAPFALNAEEDWLYLFSPEGEVVDFVHAVHLPRGGSIGRVEGERGFFRFAAPTPEKPNGPGARGITEPPSADLAPGIYDGVESLTVSLSGEGEIRYTTNGSVPTETSLLYEEPLVLTETTPLRARCFSAGAIPGETATLNYIINENHSLPVVCFDLAPADFSFIYDGSPRGAEVEANVSLYEPDGGSFTKDCGLTLHGASSRTLFVKRSMKAIFRPRYGGNLEYDVFGDGELSNFQSITLRGGTMENSYALIRDAICTETAFALDADVLALKLRYCVLYVNGRYWGIYAIREAYSEKYVADHLGIREEDVRISRAPVAYTVNQDLSDHIFELDSRGAREEERYDEVAQWLDLDSLVDWMIVQAYFTNTDVPGNVRYIYSAADGTWRYALFDLDNAMMSPDPSWDFVFDNANECGIIPRKMVQNPVFRDKLLTRMAEWLSGPLNEPYVRGVMDAFYEELEPEWPREAARWGGDAFFASSHRALTNYLSDGRGQRLIRNLARDLRLSQEEVSRYFAGILEDESS